MPRSLSIRTLHASIVFEHFLQWLNFYSSKTGGRNIKDMSTLRDKQNKMTRQRERRLSRRNCGNCGNGADTMIKWGDGQSLAICQLCLKKITSPQVPETYCAYYEAEADTFRPPHQVMPDQAEAVTEDTGAEDKVSPQKNAFRSTWDRIRNL